jgi:hypothetical protein
MRRDPVTVQSDDDRNTRRPFPGSHEPAVRRRGIDELPARFLAVVKLVGTDLSINLGGCGWIAVGEEPPGIRPCALIYIASPPGASRSPGNTSSPTRWAGHPRNEHYEPFEEVS